MSTTDRIDDLNSRREITDRLGRTVILGNSVSGSALSVVAAAAAGAHSTSEVKVPFDMDSFATMDFTNGSFGVWAVELMSSAVSLFQAQGAAIAISRFNDITTALLTWGADAMLLNIRVFTSTQAYTPTAGTAQVVVHCFGGGGGGGGAAVTGAGTGSAGSGGGAGAEAVGRITSGFSGVTITIGAGGAGNSAANGSNGGATSFGSVLIAGAGAGGIAHAATALTAVGGGLGGSASGSSSLFGASAESGETSFVSGGLALGGSGGAAAYGAGGRSIATLSGAQNGEAGSGFGAGGSGGVSFNAGAATGGAGSAGLCIVYEYNA